MGCSVVKVVIFPCIGGRVTVRLCFQKIVVPPRSLAKDFWIQTGPQFVELPMQWV